MADFFYEREVRTPYSEAYTIQEGQRQVGRIDIHFAFDLIHAAIAVDESLTQDEIQDIITYVDEDIIDAVGIPREGFVIHVFQGRETDVYTDDDMDDEGEY